MTSNNEVSEQQPIEQRVRLLEEFHRQLALCFHGARGINEREAAKRFVNRNLAAVRQAIHRAGINTTVHIRLPVAYGGGWMNNVDLLAAPLGDVYGSSMIPDLLPLIEQAIGVYEHLRDGTGLVRLPLPEVMDIEAAIERALRPSFVDTPPEDERAVQDAVSTILRALGIPFSREKEAAPVGPRGFKPDFVVADMDLAIEIKLARPSHSPAAIQEELAADIAAYRTKWRQILVVVYDLGVIADPAAMREENMKHFGVPVLVVKQ